MLLEPGLEQVMSECLSNKKGFYITTAIAYPNSRMHVGFGWEVIGADVVARFHRMLDQEVFFCTGVDEHCQNVEKAAQKAGLSSQKYCDQMAQDIQKVMSLMDISYDRFIRTSDPDHQKICQALITQAYQAGDIYKQNYEGWYCSSCEVFYTEKEAIQKEETFLCPTHKILLQRLSEENYFFKLSKYEKDLKKIYQTHPHFLLPEIRKNEILSFLEGGLKDFSVSRTSFKWGVPLPFDSKHVIYVWYDALINYLSAVQYGNDAEFFKKFWPCDMHVIGKDITRFHCIYWPAMLLSAGIELPKKVWAHGFIQFQGEKMSKTRGNIVTPDEVIQDFGVTPLRWFLVSSNSFDSDGNYSDEALILKYNADLCNNIGNLVNRVVSMSKKYFGEKILKDFQNLPPDVQAVSERKKLFFGKSGEKLESDIQSMNLSGYCNAVVDFAISLNKFIDETKPWKLAKDETKKQVLETVLAQLLEGIFCIGGVLWPIIPDASQKILFQIGVGFEHTLWKEIKLYTNKTMKAPYWKCLWDKGQNSFHLQLPQILFQRIERAPELTQSNS